MRGSSAKVGEMQDDYFFQTWHYNAVHIIEQIDLSNDMDYVLQMKIQGR